MFGDFKDALNTFLKEDAFWICLAICGTILITILVIVISFNIKKKGKNTSKTLINNDLSCLGGKENIKEKSLNGSRITLVLFDKSKFDKEKVHELGVDSILEMSDKIILVSNKSSKEIFDNLN